MRRNRKGFTLLELIIVVIVIGILASIALPRYIRIAEKGRVAEAKSLLGAIRTSQMRYSAQYGVFSTSSASLDLNFQTSRFFDFEAIGTGSLALETALVATATRKTGVGTDNPTGSAYLCNITQGGVISGDATCVQYL